MYLACLVHELIFAFVPVNGEKVFFKCLRNLAFTCHDVVLRFYYCDAFFSLNVIPIYCPEIFSSCGK